MSCSNYFTDLLKDGDFIQCNKYKYNLHFQCSVLQKTTWKAHKKLIRKKESRNVREVKIRDQDYEMEVWMGMKQKNLHTWY